MGRNSRKSLVGGERPTIYVPEFLRAPVRVRVFWYQKLWNFIKVLYRFLFRIKPKRTVPALPAGGVIE